MDDFRTLIDRATIERRIRELARDLADRYPDVPPCIVTVIEGARIFTRHLMHSLPWRTVAREVRASSYGDGFESNGSVHVSGGDSIAVEGQRVLLVEDIVDTGRTIERMRAFFLERGAVDVAVVTLLNKPSRRVVDVPVEFIGFEIPNEFVIGFGMDAAGKYRELDRVAIYEEARAAGNG